MNWAWPPLNRAWPPLNRALPACERAAFEGRLALPLAFALAALLQGAGIALMAVPSRTAAPPVQPTLAPIEAELFDKPQEKSHLVARKATRRAIERIAPSNASSIADGPPATAAQEEPNRPSVGGAGVATHGPIVAFGPAPRMPEYLRDQNLDASLMIEFTIADDGTAVPHLLSGSGNDELDALALKTARRWQFSPAMREDRPVPSKARLRLNFEVK